MISSRRCWEDHGLDFSAALILHLPPASPSPGVSRPFQLLPVLYRPGTRTRPNALLSYLLQVQGRAHPPIPISPVSGKRDPAKKMAPPTSGPTLPTEVPPTALSITFLRSCRSCSSRWKCFSRSRRCRSASSRDRASASSFCQSPQRALSSWIPPSFQASPRPAPAPGQPQPSPACPWGHLLLQPLLLLLFGLRLFSGLLLLPPPGLCLPLSPGLGLPSQLLLSHSPGGCRELVLSPSLL